MEREWLGLDLGNKEGFMKEVALAFSSKAENAGQPSQGEGSRCSCSGGRQAWNKANNPLTGRQALCGVVRYC